MCDDEGEGLAYDVEAQRHPDQRHHHKLFPVPRPRVAVGCRFGRRRARTSDGRCVSVHAAVPRGRVTEAKNYSAALLPIFPRDRSTDIPIVGLGHGGEGKAAHHKGGHERGREPELAL